MMDWVIVDRTGAYWPGLPPYRGLHSRRGYPTLDEACDRRAFLTRWAAWHYGSSGPDLRVVERKRGARRAD